MRLDSDNLPAFAQGVAVLGAGGGGDPQLALIAAQQAVERHGPVELVDGAELEPDALVLPCGFAGAATIAEERVWSGAEGAAMCKAAARECGREVEVLMPLRIGGTGGVLPVAWAARERLPLLDADGMGRSFPELYQQTMHLAGLASDPIILCNGLGDSVVVSLTSGASAGRIVGSAITGLGGVCAIAMYCLSGADAPRVTIARSLSLALRLGEAIGAGSVHGARERVCEALGATVLIEGRVAEVERELIGRRLHGALTILGSGVDSRRRLRLEFQKEFVLVLEEGHPRAAVPDLICVLSGDTCVPISIEHLRNGQPVVAIASPALEVWRSDAALALVGPSAFGYDAELFLAGAGGVDG